MSDHDVTAKCTHQLVTAQAETARLLAGLREIKIDIAAQSLHSGNSNATRAALARLETRIEHLLHAGPEEPCATPPSG